MIENLLLIGVGLVGLFFGGEWLVTGASRLARSFGISALIIGLTVVAFGTSMPELIVSVGAALGGTSDIAIGNVIGSNVANIGLILGVAGFIAPIAVRVGLLKREIPILIFISIGTYILFLDGVISRVDGFILVIGLIAFNGMMIRFAQQESTQPDFKAEEAEIEAGEGPPISPQERWRELGRIVLGLVVLLAGAQFTVQGAVTLARTVGISELVIGITLVAVGTSLPELATSVIAAFRKQNDLAIGNVVGSNIYNLLGILGITSLVRPIPIEASVIYFDGPVMIGFALLLYPFVVNRTVTRWEATMLLTAYFVFIGLTVIR